MFMIKSFKHKGLEKFYKTYSLAGIQPYHKQKLRMRLIATDATPNIEKTNLPGFPLPPLKGDRVSLWAIDVNKSAIRGKKLAKDKKYLLIG